MQQKTGEREWVEIKTDTRYSTYSDTVMYIKLQLEQPIFKAEAIAEKRGIANQKDDGIGQTSCHTIFFSIVYMACCNSII